MDLRKSKRIYAAGTTDEYMNSKKNKNLNNSKLFQKFSGNQNKKTLEFLKNQEKHVGNTVAIMEKIELMFQKDTKELENRKILDNKFENDYKQLKKYGS